MATGEDNGQEHGPEGAERRPHRLVQGLPQPGLPAGHRLGRGEMPSQFPRPEAARIGLARTTPQGAELAFVSSLRGTKRSHRLIAAVILFVMFGIPLIAAVIAGMSGN